MKRLNLLLCARFWLNRFTFAAISRTGKETGPAVELVIWFLTRANPQSPARRICPRLCSAFFGPRFIEFEAEQVGFDVRIESWDGPREGRNSDQNLQEVPSS